MDTRVIISNFVQDLHNHIDENKHILSKLGDKQHSQLNLQQTLRGLSEFEKKRLRIKFQDIMDACGVKVYNKYLPDYSNNLELDELYYYTIARILLFLLADFEKIKKFQSDTITCNFVYEVIRDEYNIHSIVSKYSED